MIGGCIDIGSNTTRLLVAERVDGRLRELARQRAFTRIGRGLRRGDTIPQKKIREVADIVAMQARLARELGTRTIRTVATAAIREAANKEDFTRVLALRAGVEVEVLSCEEEARLAFVGATNALEHPPAGDIAVIDVGGSSSEIAIGTIAGGVRATSSFRIGSGLLADSYLHSDPPTVAELEQVRAHVAGTFEGFALPTPELAVGVGGSSTSLRRLCGGVLDHATLENGLRILATTPSEVLAREFELEAERVRLLPAGMLVLAEISDRLGRALVIGGGGLREGVILEMARGTE
jgi:exopolyphosphatase / guanosine-5'-triphosphate,3'-diphosphate pyrophosphatase